MVPARAEVLIHDKILLTKPSMFKIFAISPASTRNKQNTPAPLEMFKCSSKLYFWSRIGHTLDWRSGFS